MAKFNDNKNIWIVDITLRNGEQTPRVVLDTDERMDIVGSYQRWY
jgi:isopropylmalate/homocitrate/citramalate synthase